MVDQIEGVEESGDASEAKNIAFANQVTERSQSIAEKENQIQEYITYVKVKNAELNRLSAQLEEIHQSNAWKLISILWKTRLRLVPRGSLRDKYFQSLIILLKRGYAAFRGQRMETAYQRFKKNNSITTQGLGDETETVKEQIRRQFTTFFGYEPDLDNPITFNEKIQRYKLYYRDPFFSSITDKYEVRKYIAEKIGKQYLIPLIGVYKSFDEISIQDLPHQFVLKATHGSGWNLLCYDKNTFDWSAAREKSTQWLKTNFYDRYYEWAYKSIKPRLILEQMLLDTSGDIPYDYKFFCFHGHPKFVQVEIDRFSDHTRNFFDLNWTPMPVTKGLPRSRKSIDPPQKLSEMITLAEKLSTGIPFVRVDFYALPEVYFGEMTLYPAAGYKKFDPPEWDTIIGSWLHI